MTVSLRKKLGKALIFHCCPVTQAHTRTHLNGHTHTHTWTYFLTYNAKLPRNLNLNLNLILTSHQRMFIFVLNMWHVQEYKTHRHPHSHPPTHAYTPTRPHTHTLLTAPSQNRLINILSWIATNTYINYCAFATEQPEATPSCIYHTVCPTPVTGCLCATVNTPHKYLRQEDNTGAKKEQEKHLLCGCNETRDFRKSWRGIALSFPS